LTICLWFNQRRCQCYE